MNNTIAPQTPGSAAADQNKAPPVPDSEAVTSVPTPKPGDEVKTEPAKKPS